MRDFDWARDDYSPSLRTAAIWNFILTCRLRLTLDSQKWTYPGGMTPERYEEPGCCLSISTRSGAAYAVYLKAVLSPDRAKYTRGLSGKGSLCLRAPSMLQLEFCIRRQSARQRKTAIWVRESLLALGPTFIKIGQLFSTRSDLLPAAYTEVGTLPQLVNSYSGCPLHEGLPAVQTLPVQDVISFHAA